MSESDDNPFLQLTHALDASLILNRFECSAILTLIKVWLLYDRE
jgi:hypothetical protein